MSFYPWQPTSRRLTIDPMFNSFSHHVIPSHSSKDKPSACLNHQALKYTDLIRTKTFWVMLTMLCLQPPSVFADDLADHLRSGTDPLSKAIKLWSASGLKGGLEQREQKPAWEVFSIKPLRLLGTLSSGKMTRLDALLISKGIGLTGSDFENEFKRLRAELPMMVAAKLGAEGINKPAETGSPAGTESIWWAIDALGVTLNFEPEKRVWVCVRPLTETEKSAAVAHAKQVKAEAMKARTQHKENGDILIENLPVVEAVKDGYDNLLQLAHTLQKHYSWKADVDALWKKMAGATGDDPFDVIFCEELCKEAGVKMKRLAGFDFKQVSAEIEKGNLVVVRRAYGDVRQIFLSQFAIRLRTDSTLELPSVADAADRAKWVRAETTDYTLSSIVNGFNLKRGELIFSQPGWQVNHQHLRMRHEEMKSGVYDTLLFTFE